MGDLIPIRIRKRRAPRWRIERPGYHVLRVREADQNVWNHVAVIVRGEDGFWWYAIPSLGASGRSLSALATIKRDLTERVQEMIK